MLAFLLGTLGVIWFIVKWILIVTLSVYSVGVAITTYYLYTKHSDHHERAWSKDKALIGGFIWPLLFWWSLGNGQADAWYDSFEEQLAAEFPIDKK